MTMIGSQVSSSHRQIVFRVKQNQPPFYKERWEGLAWGRDPKNLSKFPANRSNSNLGRAFTVEAARGITELTPTGYLY